MSQKLIFCILSRQQPNFALTLLNFENGSEIDFFKFLVSEVKFGAFCTNMQIREKKSIFYRSASQMACQMNFSQRDFVMLSLHEPYEFFTKVHKTQKNVSVCQCYQLNLRIKDYLGENFYSQIENE